MNEFFKIFANEIKATIEGLTGKTPGVGERNEYDAPGQEGIKPPLAVANVSVSGDINAKIMLAVTPVLVSAVSEWMLGEEEISRNENLSEDELDAAKEVFSNIKSLLEQVSGQVFQMQQVREALPALIAWAILRWAVAETSIPPTSATALQPSTVL